MIEADWVHEPHVWTLYLTDATQPRTRIGTVPDALPMCEILPEVGGILLILADYDTIAAALPALAETTLRGPALDALRPWDRWLNELVEARRHATEPVPDLRPS